MAFPSSLAPWRADRHPDPMISLSQEMGRMLDTFFSGASSLMNLSAPGALVSPVRLDVVEDQNQVCLTAEMPGMCAQDIEVRLDGNTLYLSGHKRDTVDSQHDHIHIMERSYGRFMRTVPLPFVADPTTVTADFESGVLSVHIPKRRNGDASKHIEVRERSPRSESEVPNTAMEPSPDGRRPGLAQASSREEDSGEASSGMPEEEQAFDARH